MAGGAVYTDAHVPGTSRVGLLPSELIESTLPIYLRAARSLVLRSTVQSSLSVTVYGLKEGTEGELECGVAFCYACRSRLVRCAIACVISLSHHASRARET